MKNRIIIASLVFMAGCTQLGPKAYQKGKLAKPQMQLESNAVDAAYDDHIYFSKEASSGGGSFGGGGCGCN